MNLIFDVNYCSEILRVLDSLQLTAYHKVATPVNWKHGDRCMVLPSIKAEELATTFPKVVICRALLMWHLMYGFAQQGVEVRQVPSGKAYIRLTPQPNILV